MPSRCALAESAATAQLKRHADALRFHVPGVRGGERESLHQMRVASRRMRALLRELAPVFAPEARQACRDRMTAITRALGKPRELDVCLLMIERRAQEGDGRLRAAFECLAGHLARERAAVEPQTRAAIELVEHPDFNRELLALFEGTRPVKKCHTARAAARLRARYRRLRKEYTLWEREPREEQLHTVRIRVKQLRYACEVFCDAYEDGIERITARLKEIQQILGAWNDCRVLRDYATEAVRAESAGHTVELEALVHALDDEARRRFGEFGPAASGFFTPARHKETKQTIKAPGAPCPDEHTCEEKAARSDAL